MDTVKLKIIDVTIDGKGVGKIDNMAVFVPGAALGDELEVKIIKACKSYFVGKIEKIIVPSKDRITPDCKHFSKCGGCSFRHISYDAELKIKKKHVSDCISRIGGFKDTKIDEIVPAENLNFYRNKSQIPVGNAGGKIISGFFSPHSHRIVNCDECLLHPAEFDKIVCAVKFWMERFKIPAYNEASGKGLVRHIYMRYAEKTGEIMVCLAVNGGDIPFKNELLKVLTENFKNIKGVILNINREKTNVILGKKSVVIWGKGFITDELCGFKFNISPLSFYQVNRSQTERLYNLVKSNLNLSKNSLILDLYCGIGTIGLSLSGSAREIIGAEIVPEAVKDAKENARINGINNAKFFCCDASEIAEKLKNFNENLDAVVIDPPRKGCSLKLIEDVIKMEPKKIAYVSCNPATLARDLKIFSENSDFKIEKIIPVDMFPRTSHVETVVLLGRKMVDDRNIEYEYVDYEPKDNEYMRNTKGSATYAEIKSWIKEQYNVSVSSLYIAQCKDECGFEKRENYNTGAEGHKVPQCPDEKRKMIMEAFKHFRMI